MNSNAVTNNMFIRSQAGCGMFGQHIRYNYENCHEKYHELTSVIINNYINKLCAMKKNVI